MHQSIVELASFDVGSRVSSFTCIVGITLIDHDLESDNDKDQNENGFDGDDIDTHLKLKGDKAAEELPPIPDQHHVREAGELFLHLGMRLFMDKVLVMVKEIPCPL